jgi:hypothetical protein
MVSMEVGPRDYLMEMLKVLSTVLGGSTKLLPMLASKVDECTHPGPRACLESGRKVIELEDGESSQSGSMGQDTVMDAFQMDGYDDAGLFDFGTLSEASMAWLGSMSDDSFGDMAAMNGQPVYQQA